ncbi:hypothetical protein BGZ83_002064 [Gryganskiella cystojenkinii]|nr:hypothetical protein BGZ83_002064 [Gryganskiella cystojenkinii]
MMGKDSLNNDASKKSKKTKKVKLLRNPFADSFLSDSHRREGKDLNFSNPFLDSKGLLLKEDGSDGGHNDDNDDGEEDEERVVQARRETLAALDPKNKNASKHAEFKSLKVRQPILQDEQGYYQQQQDEQAQEQAPDQHINQGPFSDIRPPETIPVPAPASIIIETPPLSTRHSRPPTSDHKHNASFSSIADIDQSNSSPGHNVTNSLLSTPKRVPEIAICQATPSPPSSGRHHHRGSSLASIVQHNSTLLSTNYTPSPLSLWADDDFGSAAKVPSNRSTVIYKNTFQRVGSASITVSPLPLESRIQGGDHDVLPDHIGVEIEKKSKLSFEEPQVKRNTFGQTGDNKPRRSGSQKKRGKRNTGHLSSLDPWDSCDDMLAPRCSDDEDEDRQGWWKET